MAKTNISWCDDTWNPIVGCSIKSTGCKNCYAMRAAWRMAHNPKTPQYHGTATLVNGKPVWTGKMSFAEKAFEKPLNTRKPTRFFVNSMGDLFHEDVPDDWIDRVFAVMALCPQHIFQVLTKRPDRMRDYMLARWQGSSEMEIAGIHFPAGPETGRRQQVEHACEKILGEWRPSKIGHKLADPDNDDHWDIEGGLKAMQWAWPLPNVHLGVSVEDQTTADDRIPRLLDTPAAVRWISAEPLLGPVDLIAVSPNDVQEIDCLRGHSINPDWSGCVGLDWVVVGGESGPGARPMHPDWARSIRDQCQAAGAPFHFKQHGAFLHDSQDPNGQWDWSDADERNILFAHDDGTWSMPLGKKRAGRLLDGVEHNGQVS